MVFCPFVRQTPSCLRPEKRQTGRSGVKIKHTCPRRTTQIFKSSASTCKIYTLCTANTPCNPTMPPTPSHPTMLSVLQEQAMQFIELAAKRYGFQILGYATWKSWTALKRLHAEYAHAQANSRRPSRGPETEPDLWEITQEEFEQAVCKLVGHR